MATPKGSTSTGPTLTMNDIAQRIQNLTTKVSELSEDVDMKDT